MVTKSQEKHTDTKQNNHRPVISTIKKGMKTLGMFWTKFNNDWAWNNAAGLAYNLILAVFPIIITLLSVLGFFLSTLDPGAYQSALDKITGSSSALREAKPIVAAAFQQVKKDAGLL